MAETKKTSTSTKKTTTKKPVVKKSTTKKPVPKKTQPKKPVATKKSTLTKQTTTPVKKSSVKKPVSSKSKTVTAKTSSPEMKKPDAVSPGTLKKEKSTKNQVKKKPKKLPTKTSKQVKDAVVTKKAIEEVFEGKDQNERKKFGKTFYLIFSLSFFGVAYLYINNVLYDNQDHLQSALFAFAALFVVFVLLNFGIHRVLINFFRLPFKYLFTEARLEIKKDIIADPDKKGVSARFSKYKAIFTLVLYLVILMLLVGSQIYNGILDGDKILVIITQSLSTALIFLLIICSWQYLFNIIPGILDSSIDAKNGFILTLSAVVMIIYVVFIIFDISVLAELMIFILIIGFIALLGVNLNMIVGEFNIFVNLRKGRRSKTVTRAVFIIFFSFHMYVILYASVVAYSIYNANPDTYNFVNTEYEEVLVEGVNRFGTVVSEVYDNNGVLITVVYDSAGNEITNYKDSNGMYIQEFYDINGDRIEHFYLSPEDLNPINEVEFDNIYYYEPGSNVGDYSFTYYEGTLVGINKAPLQHTYGDMLYYAVITISSVGYGDISPNTNYDLPIFWGGFLSIYGLTFYALSIGYVSNIAFMGITENREEE